MEHGAPDHRGDRFDHHKPRTAGVLVLVAITSALMLVLSSALGLFVPRFIASVASGMYGPAARGKLVDRVVGMPRAVASPIAQPWSLGQVGTR